MAFCSPSTIFLMLLLFHSLQLHKSAHGNDERYEACKKTFQCGNVSLSYPFYDEENRPAYCGYPGFRFNCSNARPEIYMSSETYYILNVDPTSHTISVAWQRFWEDLCPEYLHNASIAHNLYKYTPQHKNITLIYNCPKTSSLLGYEIFCDNSKRYRKQYSPVEYIMTQDLESSLAKNLNTTCPDSILVPVPVHGDLYSTITDSKSLQAAILTGFGLEWIAENELCDICSGSGGECGYNEKIPGFICYCRDQPYDSKCSPRGNGSTPHKIPKYAKVLIACLGTLIGIGMLVLLAYYVRRRRNSTNNQDIGDFLRTNGPLTPKKYTYKFLKKITNSFADNNKLGEGGCGIVYKGKLRKDHLVAVKLLKESRDIAEDFSNEVESIGRTNHINIVRLLGFCCEGQKRALVYAFMPNGSLDKFISGKKNCLSLASDKLLEIALGIARGLQYLHQFCNTRIVHFDIKPHNILLDEKFCPKISDFGLAKRCQTNASIVSMSQARGTRGFIAPEVRSKSHGEVSHKSDVYSYGMLVLDMVGCRRDVNVDKRRSTQYFPDWIYDQLEQMEEDENQEMLNGAENETLRKMILVSLWCIQENPLKRPAMNKVVEMLEGPLDLLQIPPEPSLSSSRISKHSSSTAYTTSE